MPLNEIIEPSPLIHLTPRRARDLRFRCPRWDYDFLMRRPEAPRNVLTDQLTIHCGISRHHDLDVEKGGPRTARGRPPAHVVILPDHVHRRIRRGAAGVSRCDRGRG